MVQDAGGELSCGLCHALIGERDNKLPVLLLEFEAIVRREVCR